ncbi:MAG: restriction endonuclease subunit S [Burkholderiales bacterium]
MKVAAYSKYKPSSISWLDQMPAHWKSAALRWMSRRYAGGTPDKGNDAYWEDGEIPWINSGAVNDGYITTPSTLITREGFANSSAKWIPKDALVMALAGQGKTKGMVAQLGIETTCNQSMAAIIPDHRFAPRYLYWWLSANYQNIRNLAGGEARDGLNLDMLGSIPCPVPPLEEQQTIARFLDAQTARIDTLVAKKRQLIAKLKEKRSALIARTVTSGLPPEAAKAAGLEPNPVMKDSGVAWIGAVPQQWLVLPFKRRSRFIEGPGIMAADFLDEGVPLIRISGLSEKFASLDGANYLDPDLVAEKWAHFRTKKGDLLISGSASTGLCCEVDEVAAGAIPYTGIIIIRSIEGLSCKGFLRWYFQSDQFLTQVGLLKTGSTIQHFGPSHLSQMMISLPAAEVEQQAIADYLDTETAMLDRLIGGVGAAVARLTEYRQALITSAVTGKIDVRGWQPDKEAA